jgi:hypothetical protein
MAPQGDERQQATGMRCKTSGVIRSGRDGSSDARPTAWEDDEHCGVRRGLDVSTAYDQVSTIFRNGSKRDPRRWRAHPTNTGAAAGSKNSGVELIAMGGSHGRGDAVVIVLVAMFSEGGTWELRLAKVGKTINI